MCLYLLNPNFASPRKIWKLSQWSGGAKSFGNPSAVLKGYQPGHAEVSIAWGYPPTYLAYDNKEDN